MNKRKKMFLDYKTSENLDLIKRLQEYYAVKDIDDGKNYLKIFNDLYVSKEKYTLNYIAYKFFVSFNTLQNYIKMFNELAQKLSNVK